jgi:hypothetical protein
MTGISAVRYDASHRAAWDTFVERSKNGTFLFRRDYMEYHADRFQDHSLLFFEGTTLAALFPANRAGDELVSHGGLTFGGVVSDDDMKVPTMIAVLGALREHAKAQGMTKIVYKTIPHIYHRIPAEEDLYALFVAGARLYRRDVSSTILQSTPVGFAKGRRGCIKKGIAHGVTVRRTDDYAGFMRIEEDHLQRKHGKKPVHSASEMAMLAGRFPENIRLFAGYLGDEMLGGVILYVSRHVAHAQYIAATEHGKSLGALDVVMASLLQEHFKDIRYFDFGISTDRAGLHLDEGLIANKESFGARATVYDFYEIPVLDPNRG